ncbi:MULTISPECIES: DUF885 domain-containing protein [unclassified Arsukibacterium]|uniref:DUF885 domain-containing protein n=1 Tax=unclassified Arsukibacterium TaxID=2635278 RepID=UPI000C62529C|nr:MULTISPECIES: DUF885 domain-containing protein [unclassified Arsukibacterium]MAA94824.1 DUF885 domain-containing protein [Rheinheimera sp.]MBM34719.1 DUF885 domain-containing protein [Rheinheimera sp.]HAW93023.1 DUF885 domain-containing protein [Candidatus Azambacteria bacterium]
MRIIFTMTFLLLSLAGCAAGPLQNDPDQHFTELAEQLWQAETTLTASEPDRLPDMSPAALGARQQQRLKWQQQLQQVDVAKLSEQNQINHAILAYRLANDIDEYRFNAHLTPLTSESGFHTSVAMMLQRSALRQLADYENYLQKLATVPVYMQQQTDWMRQGLLTGITQPKAVLAGFEQSISSYITEDMAASVFFRPFMTKPDTISAIKWQQLQDRAQQIIVREVNPAYQAYYDFMVQDYIPGARDTIAASALADGEAFYQNRLEHYTTLKLTPQQVHDTGLAEVKRIRADMQAIIEQLGFAGSFADFIQFLRTDPQFYPQSDQELMRYAAWLSKQADAELPRLFKTLPRTPYGVVPVPAEIAPKYTTGRYSGASRDDQAGFYWVNTYALNRRPLYEMPALTLHEAVPGHHLQISLAREQASLPDYRRSFYTSAFGEGWGLYAEYLGLEMGFYDDPYSNFGRLTYEMWRAARLVVDTGMHSMGWSRQQAIDFLAANTALSMHNVTTEIDRYISWPAQALSYKLGEITIRRLRAEAEQKLADKFDIRRFHDVVLSNGSVPLAVLEQQVAAYISTQLAEEPAE